jgi:hypothetical protein
MERKIMMRFQHINIWLGTLLLSASIAAHAETSGQAASGSNPCDLVKPDDVTALLGGKAVTKSTEAACSWSVAGSKYKLIAIKYANSGMSADMAFETMRMKSRKAGAALTDESGLGDKAFLRMEPWGVSLMIMKGGHLLQLQYGSGVAGTDKEVGALLPIAKKAVDAF